MTTKDTNTETTENETETNANIDLAQVIGLLQVKLDAANSQILHLGLLVEYLYKELDEKEVGLNLEAYPEWAQTRFKEIQTMATTDQGQKIQEEMKSEMEAIAKSINLTT